MRADFYNFHWPAIEHFSALSWGTAIAKDYPVSNNPLLYMIASLLPLHGNQKIYHAITFLIALLIWPLLAWAYHRRYSNYGIGWLWALFGASAILISPSFRSSAFWGTTDYLPIAFCVGTSLLLSRFQDLGVHEARTIPPSTLVTLAFISSCAFYTRQFYAFLPVFAAWTVLTRTKTAPFLVFGVFFMALLPELFLIYVWKGINAPSNQFVFHPTLTNVALVGCNIAFVSTPLILGCIRRPFGDVFPRVVGGACNCPSLCRIVCFHHRFMAYRMAKCGRGDHCKNRRQDGCTRNALYFDRILSRSRCRFPLLGAFRNQCGARGCVRCALLYRPVLVPALPRALARSGGLSICRHADRQSSV